MTYKTIALAHVFECSGPQSGILLLPGIVIQLLAQLEFSAIVLLEILSSHCLSQEKRMDFKTKTKE